ncbi:MAG: tetratricopeptide repeat protein [Bacteroidota bacterium]|nr:tetratricopeptide repeat protein [Bacteroidota bacterium]
MKKVVVISFILLILPKVKAQSLAFKEYLKINDSLQYFEAMRISKEIKKFENKFKEDSSLFFYRKILFGDFVNKKSNSQEALKSYFAAIDLANHNPEKLFLVYYKAGRFYFDNDNLSSATAYFNKALLSRTDTCHTNLDFRIYYEQGLINTYLDNSKTAIEYYNKALKIAERNKSNKQRAAAFNNLGLIFIKINDSVSSKQCFVNSLKLRLRDGDSIYIAQSYNNIGAFYYNFKNYNEALTHYKLGYAMRKNNNAPPGALVESQINIGKALYKLNQFNESLQIFNLAIKQSKEINNIELERRVLEPLIEMSEKSKEYEKAYFYQKRYNFIKDSLYGVNKIEDVKKLTFQYEFSKKLQQDSLKYEKKDLERKKQIEIREEKNKLLNYVLLIIVIALGVCTYFIFKLKKSNSQRKHANLLISKQKDEIEQKQKEILDSIKYAKRIQKAMLPSDKFIDRSLKKKK